MRFELTEEAYRRRQRHKLLPVRALLLADRRGCSSEELAPDGRLVRNYWACLRTCMETLELSWRDFETPEGLAAHLLQLEAS